MTATTRGSAGCSWSLSTEGRVCPATLMRRRSTLIGGRPSVLDAQSPLAGWYATFGYEQTGPEFLDDGIPHVPMRRP